MWYLQPIVLPTLDIGQAYVRSPEQKFYMWKLWDAIQLSQLEYHKTVHKTIASYGCVYPKCKRSFMQKGDLTLHAQIHDKLTWKCNDCKWTTTCQKYLKAHIDNYFEELRYGCSLCEKRFKWRQQLKCHHENDHNWQFLVNCFVSTRAKVCILTLVPYDSYQVSLT